VNRAPQTVMNKRRLLVLVSLGALLVGGVLGYCHYWLSLPAGSGPAGPAVLREPFAEVWTDREVLLLGLGDSITAGFGVDPQHSYFGRLAENPHDEWPDMQGICLKAVLPNLRTVNLAVSGSSSLEHLELLHDRLDAQESDVFGLVVLTTGGNDIIHWYGTSPPREGAMYGATLEQAQPWIDNFAKRLDQMIDLIEERFPGGCKVFLADIYDPTDAVGDAPRAGLSEWPDGLAIHAAYNEVIHRCAAERACVHLVPLYREFLGHGIHCRQPWQEHYRSEDPYYWYADNLEDPNVRGYDAIRRLMLIEIAKVANELADKPP
jgi:lysophospholipase L1-like esterase